ncbi:MAG: hypothetical protein AB1760_00185 [Pseudomonadota bacterium]
MSFSQPLRIAVVAILLLTTFSASVLAAGLFGNMPTWPDIAARFAQAPHELHYDVTHLSDDWARVVAYYQANPLIGGFELWFLVTTYTAGPVATRRLIGTMLLGMLKRGR